MTMTETELKAILAEHDKYVHSFGKEGKLADFSGVDLSYANLEEAKLRGAIFRGANLRHACLFSAYLADADFTGANLYKVNLDCADLHGANLRNANMLDTSFCVYNTDFRGSNADEALGIDEDMSEWLEEVPAWR